MSKAQLLEYVNHVILRIEFYNVLNVVLTAEAHSLPFYCLRMPLLFQESHYQVFHAKWSFSSAQLTIHELEYHIVV